MKNPPTYSITSVDNALVLATVMQLEGPITVAEAAERLGVARSTAHRLLAMLCFRDFAVQDEDRRYRAGPLLARSAVPAIGAARLRAIALPHLADLTAAVDESSNLTVLSGPFVRFLASVESSQFLRIGSREGMAFPAHHTSGGLAMLARLSGEEVEARFTQDAGELGEKVDVADLLRQLAVVRERGFALNDGLTERGIVAIGRALTGPDGTLAALSIALPSTRWSPTRLASFTRALAFAVEAVERDLALA